MLWFRRRHDPDLSAAMRGRAFAAGFRCGQLSTSKILTGQYRCPELGEWEIDEAMNAVKQGFTTATEFARKTAI